MNTKLIRVMAWSLRILKKYKKTGPILVTELSRAEELIVRLTQSSAFFTEILYLKEGKKLRNDSKILYLNPFLDDKGIL